MELRERRGFGIKLREPNLFVEARAKLNRWELFLWLFTIKSVKVATGEEERESTLEELKKKKKKFSAYALVDLRKLAEYVVLLRDRENRPEVLKAKDVLDYSDYFRKVLEGMVKKAVFQVKVEDYKRTLEGLGYGYWLEILPGNIDKTSVMIIAPIDSVFKIEGNAVQVNFSSLVAPIIAEYKKWFTSYQIEELLKLKSRSALALYRMFRAKLGLNQTPFRITIGELKEILGVKIKNSNLSSKILKPAIAEINKKTSLKVDWNPIRRGRGGKIVAFEFRVNEKPVVLTPDLLLKNQLLLEEWLSKTLSYLVNLLKKEGEKLTLEELAKAFLGVRGIDKATALWFLLHFTESSLLSAWKILKEVEQNNAIRLKERFLKSVIPNKKKEYDFLLDPRIKPLLEEKLKKLEAIDEVAMQETLKEENPLATKIKHYWEQLTNQGKKVLLENFGVNDFNDLLKQDLEKVWGALRVIYRIHAL